MLNCVLESTVAELYCILCTSFCLVSSGQVAYQRDVYYRYKSLLKSVANVRFLCNKLAFYLSVPPARLYIVSTLKLLERKNPKHPIKFGFVLTDLQPQGTCLRIDIYGADKWNRGKLYAK